jgi:hypothetical protein
VGQFDKEASQTRDYCVAKSATHRTARPDPSPRKKPLLRMTIKLIHYRKTSMTKLITNSAMLLSLAGAMFAQAGKAPSVTVAPIETVTAQRAAQTPVTLDFRVGSGFHINSNAPKSEFLIPTALKMDLPTDIVLGKIAYPEGKDLTFPFSPNEKLNVYSGDFEIKLMVHPLHSVTPGKYVMHGSLRYQACDNAQCFPPKTLPVNFDVKVVKEPPGPHKNPAQSPHVHN